MARALGVTLAGLGVLAGGAALTIGTGAEAWGPRTVPILAAATLAAAGLAEALLPSSPPAPSAASSHAVEGEIAQPGAFGAADGPAREARVAWMLALGVLYALAIERVGYLAATAPAAAAAFWLFGARRPLTLALAALVVPLALHGLFFRVLGIFPPLGRWFDVLDVVPL